MLDLTSLDSREDFKVAILHKAIKDSAYRETLMKSPSAILEQELEQDFASSLTLAAHQETPERLYVVVNYNPKAPHGLGDMKIDKEEGVEAFLVRKAWKDPVYKAELLSNPLAKIRDEFGMDLKGGATVVALAETPTSMHIIVPKAVLSQNAAEERADNELGMEDLDRVSGGVCSVITWIRYTLSKAPSETYSHCCQYASGVRG
jgi:hypothetical protein